MRPHMKRILGFQNVSTASGQGYGALTLREINISHTSMLYLPCLAQQCKKMGET